ncbi:MAG: hypothetical protein C7B47_06235 [Sulfobacillus thermosulfidooxidans]|uniref:MFS transporter n=1 Tax=Sulfobacillus thermosulfidooxidans TaxID=28034 RepID=A0A2T2X0Q7_SULTH|nr:MAG: hypothetical protein C7B47_06235 [Sulfobacillus thermosulfidooxidans]
MSQSVSSPSSHQDEFWLLANNASVSLGAHFREIALGLFLTHLNASPKAYAWYFLMGSIPSLFTTYIYQKIRRRYSSKSVMVFTYVIRLLAAITLWQVSHFTQAIAVLFVFAASRSLYQIAEAPYLTKTDNGISTGRLISWLRQTESLIDLIGPLLAGWVLMLCGYRQGFLINAVFYLIGLAFIARLSKISPTKGEHLTSQVRSARRIEMPLFVIWVANFLVWIGNVMSMAYLFHILHKGPLSYGLIVTLWGGSGIFSGQVLRRLSYTKLSQFMALWFGLLAISWFIISQDIGYALFCVATVLIGFSWWMIQDSLTTIVLTSRSGHSAALSQARLQAFGEMGSFLGMLVIVLLPSRILHIQTIFQHLALWALVLAGGLCIYAVIIHKSDHCRIHDTK